MTVAAPSAIPLWQLPAEFERMRIWVVEATGMPPAFAELLPHVIIGLSVMALLSGFIVGRRRQRTRRLAGGKMSTTSPRSSMAGSASGILPVVAQSEVANPAILAGLQQWRAMATAALVQAKISSDYNRLESAMGLTGAMRGLESALSAFTAAAPQDPGGLVAVLRQGLEQQGWLHRLFRAELILTAFASPGTPWFRLGVALGAIGGVVRAELAMGGVDVTLPALLAPAQRGHDVADEALSDLHRISFINRAVRSTLGSVAEPGRQVVDVLRVGVRIAGAPGDATRESPPLVVLYAPLLWRAAAPA